MNNLIESANVYSNLGLSVIPTKKDKSPTVKWTSFQERRMINGEIETKFSHSEVSGIGIICGKVSGNLEVIDIDCKYDKTGKIAEEFFSLVKDNTEIFENLVVVHTKNAGWHIYYKCSKIQGNQKLAINSTNEVLFETRGEGGYVIAPPSPGYVLKKGSFDNIPEISAKDREILLGIASTFDESVKETAQSSYKEEMTGLSPFEDYNNRADVIRLLEKHGWVTVKQSGDRIQLRRPGKTEGSESGNWHAGKRIFFVFSTSTQFDTWKGYNSVGVYCLLECNNDFSEASRRLFEEGYGDIKANFTEKKNKKNEPCLVIPPFPVNGFPDFIKEFLKHCTEVFGTPIDFWGGAIIAALATAIGDKLELTTNYRNNPVLWLNIIGDVSSGKSEALDLCLRPFMQHDSESIKKYHLELAEYDRKKRLTKQDKLAEGVDEVLKPACYQYILNDFTPESMADAHSINPRGIIIVRDELKGWIDDFGRYSKSGEQSNMLSTWSQKSVTYNRKTTGIINISKPVILIAGGMQPDLIPTLAADHRAENGFLARFCNVFPNVIEKAPYSKKKIDKNIYLEYVNLINHIRLIPEPSELTLSPEAEAAYSDWYGKNKLISDEAESGYLKGVYGKLDIIALRLSILIEGTRMFCEKAHSDTISLTSMMFALEITEYFRATALKVYGKIFSAHKGKIEKSDVIKWVLSNLQKSKTEIAKFFDTSRSQVDRIEDKYKK